MTYRVAFAISGAVSLGSYEAGTVHFPINGDSAELEFSNFSR